MSDPDASTLPASDPQVSTTEPLPSRASLSGTEKKDPETYDFVLRLRCAQQGWGRGGGCVCDTEQWLGGGGVWRLFPGGDQDGITFWRKPVE